MLRKAIAASFLAVAAITDYVFLADAYGSGPPYYGQTTNMDKWSSPWPVVAAVTIIGVAIAAWLWRRAGRR